MKSSKHPKVTTRNEPSKELMSGLSNVLKSVDKLKAGLTKAERKLAKARKEEFDDLQNLEEIIALDQKPIRKVCKIVKDATEPEDEVIAADFRTKRKRFKKEEIINSQSNWNELFRKRENIIESEIEDSDFEMMYKDDFHIPANLKVNYLNDDIPQSSRVLRRPTTAPETSRLSAGYDPSDHKNKFLDRNSEETKELKLKIGKINQKTELSDNRNKSSPRKRSLTKEQKLGSWNDTKKADGLRKLDELVEKQQMKLIKRAKSASDGKISSKPTKPILPIAISSQNMMSSNQRVNAPPNRKIAQAPPVTSYPGFSDPRRLEPRHLSLVKGKKIDKNLEIKADGSNRKTITKKVAKISGNIEDYIICPSSWRKGQELVLKELGPFKLSSDVGKSKDKKHKTEEDLVSKEVQLPVSDCGLETEFRSIANQLIPDDAKNDSQGKDVIEFSKSEELTEPKDQFDDNPESESVSEYLTTSKSISEASKKPNLLLGIKRKTKNIKTEETQAPKIRHYNPDVVRTYMQKQKKERLQQLLSEKQRKQQEKKEREQKLQDLQRLQKKLAKAALPKHGETKKDSKDSEDDQFELLSNTSNQEFDIENENKIEDNEKSISESDHENAITQSEQINDPPVTISEVYENEPKKLEFREIKPEEIYKKIQDFDNILASIKLLQDPKPKSSIDKLERIHATAVSLEQQIDSETNRITQILHQSSNNVILDSFYQQPITVNGDGNDSASPMPSDGQGEASRSSRGNSAVSSRPFQTRHERIVRSKSQFSVFDGSLPGVTNLVRHAQSVASFQVREESARKIQAAYRGFKVRQTLKWRFENRKVHFEQEEEINGNVVGSNSPLSEGTLTDDPDIDVGKNLLPEFCAQQNRSNNTRSSEFLNLPIFSKPDPYNFINTLHRTMNQVNISPASSKITVFDDLDKFKTSESKELKEMVSVYSDDFEQNSEIVKDSQVQPEEIDELTSKSVAVAILESQIRKPHSVASEIIETISDDDTLSEGSLPSEFETGQTSPPIMEKTSEASGLKSELEELKDSENESKISNYRQPGNLKFSPSSLKLKMSGELMYLESLEGSLRQLEHMERIQGIGLAQQETVTLAQALQNERQKRIEEIEKFKTVVQQDANEREKQLAETQKQQQAALSAAIESVNLVRSETAAAINTTTHKLLNTQAEAAKITADAAKQLADASVGFTRDIGEISKGTATSAAIAAVTSVLQELKRKPSRKGSMSDNSLSYSGQETATRNESSSDEVYSRDTKLSDHLRSLVSSQATHSNNQVANISVNTLNSSSKSILEEGPLNIEKSGLINGTYSDGSVTEEVNEEQSISYSTQFEESNSEREIEKFPSRKSISTDKGMKKNGSKNENRRSVLSLSAERLSGSDGFENSKSRNSFNNFTLEMVKQYMKKEEMRAKHEMALLKLREKSLIEKTKAEVAWLELQKQQFKEKGEDDKMPPLRKRQRWLMLRLQQEQSEIRRLREAQLVASQERQMLLEQQQQIAQLRQSTRQILGRIREISPGMQIPSLRSLPSTSRSLEVSPKSSLRLQVLSSSDTVQTDEEINNPVTDTQSDVGEIVSDIQTPASRDSKSDSELQIEVSDSSYKSSLARRVLHGLKKLERNKRVLTEREQKLLEKKKDVESLIQWREKLKVEEKEVEAMEKIAKVSDNVPLDFNLNNDIPEEILSGPKTTVEQISDIESKLEEGTLDVTEQIPSPEGPITEPIKTKSQEVKMDSSGEYGNSFESSTSQPKSISSEKHIPFSSVSLRLPLSPRTYSKRRDSSGSEDSFTVSQSETASDLSDIEGRVHALKEELRRRKVEADRLRKEQKRRSKERLKAQEASLLKQIEAYDRFINQAKTELDHELEVDTQVKVTKPQIRQPRFAESRHGTKIQNSLSIQAWSEGAGDEFDTSPKTPKDDTIASSLSELSMSETNKSFSTEDEPITEPTKRDENAIDGKMTESEASSSDSVKTVTEKTEDLDRIQTEDKQEIQIVEGNEENENLKINEINLEDIKVYERSPSDDETVAEEIVDEEVDVVVDEATRVPQEDKISDKLTDYSSPIAQSADGQMSNENPSDLVSPITHTSSASSSSTYQDRKKKIDNVINEKIETLISSLVEKELNDAVEEVADLVKKKKKSEKSDFVCNLMTEKLFTSIYDSSLDLIFSIRNKRNKPSTPLNIGNRIREIMMEFELKSANSSPQERPSLSDILSLSSPSAYNDVLTSPEGSASLSESPARAEGLDSPISRPFSPVLGHPSDPFQANSDKFADSDSQADQDWFEDDLDGTNNYYQIYPYKQSYIIREIPNKAPPPYTPPHQGISSTSVFTMTPNLSTQTDSTQEKQQCIASHTEAEIQTLVARATTYVHNSLAQNETAITPPDNYFVIQATDDDCRILDSGQSAFRHFIFDLTKEIVSDVHFAAHQPPRAPWMKPKWVSQRRPGPSTRSSTELISHVQRQVFGFIKVKTSSMGSSGSLAKKNSSITVISKKKQDRVDEILVKELREEELDWVTYEDDEVFVKKKVADTILNCLIAETAQVMYGVHERRRGPQR